MNHAYFVRRDFGHIKRETFKMFYDIACASTVEIITNIIKYDDSYLKNNMVHLNYKGLFISMSNA